MSLKSAAFFALIGMVLLTVLLAVGFMTVASEKGAKMAAPEVATVPSVDGSGCARGLAGSALAV
jgi:hypothetical protein